MCDPEAGQAARGELELTANRHAKFLQRTLHVLPAQLASYDTQRVTIAYFAISGLDVLDRLDLLEDQKDEIIEWLYLNLICPTPGEDPGPEVLRLCGFRGSPALRLGTHPPSHQYDHGHVAMTYTALASLVILGDDLARVNRPAVLAGVRALQLPDGSFQAALQGGENDMRFLYCAAAICHMLGDWAGMDRGAALRYVLASFSYEGGIGQGPGLEAHGGSTYCAVAALSLMGQLGEVGEARLEALGRWCLARQGRQAGAGGFQGRPNKPEDTCYSFWVGATLALLGRLGHCDPAASRQFVLSTQDPVTGGLAKWTDTRPDPLHTYLGLSGLAIAGEAGLQPVEPGLNITRRAATRLGRLQEGWAADRA
jgi:geranylgeranyl transferase type-1 subunit beta